MESTPLAFCPARLGSLELKNRRLQRLTRPLGPSRRINMLGVPAGLPIAGAMTTDDVDHLVETYRATSALATPATMTVAAPTATGASL